MLTLESYQLTHPELLSVSELREILINSCIEAVNIDKLCKSELVDLYRKVALPLPQRTRGNIKQNEIETDVNNLSDSTAIPDKAVNDICATNKNLNNETRKMSQASQLGRLKPPINECKSLSKKIRLSATPKVETESNGLMKRRSDEKSEESSTRKRQKITYP